jgi:squalene-hopene/tetraprenyl-beta-curcumene cyclase
MSAKWRARWWIVAAALLCGLAPLVRAGGAVGPDPAQVKVVLDKAIQFLKEHQNKDGSFVPKLAGPGVSALVAAGLIRNGISPDDPLVAKTLAYLEKQVQKDGGIYNKFLANYTTSVAVMAFHEANTKGKYDTLLKNASDFLRKLQYGGDESDTKFGGLDYGEKKKRADLSNTAMWVEAMLAAGVPKDDPNIQKALKFISRCQNLPGEHQDQAFAKKATEKDKGGFTYIPDPDDNPHKTDDGGLRSLGAMTYGGLKSFLYAGVSKDDPRVKAAVKWIANHYTLEENPGMGKSGLYYYYHTFGKAMAALGEDYFTDAKGKKHDWRKELFTALQSRQQADGSWRNEGDKAFQEGTPELATAFAVLTLSYCQPPKK